jgi:tetratricopeptide (TPR) repeat protein
MLKNITLLILFFTANIRIHGQHSPSKLSLHKGFYLLTIDRVESMKHLNDAIQQDSTYGEAYYYRGLLHYKSGKYQKAISDFETAYICDNTLTLTYIYKGFALRNLGELDSAVENFTQYISLNPTDTSAYSFILRGKIRNAAGDHQGAIDDYDLAVALKPIEEKYYYYRFLSNQKKGKFTQALKEINKAIEINPDFYGYHFYKGSTLFSLKKYKEAIVAFNESVAINSYNADGYYQRGNVQVKLLDHHEAIESFNMAIMITEDGAYYSHRGNSKYATGDNSGACEDWGQANDLGYYEDYEKMKKLCK